MRHNKNATFSINKKKIVIYLLFVVVSFIACSPLLSQGWFVSHDVQAHIERLIAVSHEMKLGNYYPRWLSSACFGKGLPVLNFYSPGFYLVIGALHLFGAPLVIALKIFCFLVFFLGAWGMFQWTRGHTGEYGALIASIIYTFLPYHFVDIYVRGALPEFAALALLPWLFHAIDLSFSYDRYFQGIVLTASVSAALVLTHNLSAFMIIPFGIVYFSWCAYPQKKFPRKILAAISGPLFGAGLSAFYWLPMIMELKYLRNFKKATVEAFNYSDHFVYPFQWFLSFWGFGHSRPGVPDGMSFQVGYVLLIYVVLALLSLLISPAERWRFGAITFLLGAIGLFMTIDLSSFIYRLIGSMQYVQFPWRFIGISTLFFAAFTGLSSWFNLSKCYHYVSLLLITSAFILCIYFSQDHRTVTSEFIDDLDHIETISMANNSLELMASSEEYVPKWATSDSSIPIVFDANTVLRSFSSKNITYDIKGSSMQFFVDGTGSNSQIIIPCFYFPGWQAKIDDKTTSIGADPNGFISIKVPPGDHIVRLWFGTTWPRIMGWIIAAITSSIMGVMAVRRYHEMHRFKEGSQVE